MAQPLWVSPTLARWPRAFRRQSRVRVIIISLARVRLFLPGWRWSEKPRTNCMVVEYRKPCFSHSRLWLLFSEQPAVLVLQLRFCSGPRTLMRTLGERARRSWVESTNRTGDDA